MKQILIACAAVLVFGCASTTKKISGMSTSELKLRRQQLMEEIAQPVGFRMAGFHPGTEDHDSQLKEKQKIEFELLKRCEAGDKSACLPSFDR